MGWRLLDGPILAAHIFSSLLSFLQIGTTAGPECKTVLQEITHLVDEQLNSDRQSIKELFGASKVTLHWYLSSAFLLKTDERLL